MQPLSPARGAFRNGLSNLIQDSAETIEKSDLIDELAGALSLVALLVELDKDDLLEFVGVVYDFTEKWETSALALTNIAADPIDA